MMDQVIVKLNKKSGKASPENIVLYVGDFGAKRLNFECEDFKLSSLPDKFDIRLDAVYETMDRGFTSITKYIEEKNVYFDIPYTMTQIEKVGKYNASLNIVDMAEGTFMGFAVKIHIKEKEVPNEPDNSNTSGNSNSKDKD